MNKVCLVGRLVANPKNSLQGKIKDGKEQVMVVSSIAINEKAWGGESKTTFINCKFFKNQAENFLKYVRKGDLVGIEGKLATENYKAKDGTMRYTTLVYVTATTFIGSRNQIEEEAQDGTSEFDVPPVDSFPTDDIPF